MRRTKIVATLGPTSDNSKTIAGLIEAGVNVFRFNFSHGTHDSQLKTMNLAKEVAAKLNRHVALMLDTKGAEIRTGLNQESQAIAFHTGDRFRLTMNTGQLGTHDAIDISYAGVFDHTDIGHRVLFDDGTLETIVVDKDLAAHELIVEAQNSLLLGEHKGVNIPGVQIDLKGLTDRDRDDISFGVKQGIQFIAASFVRKPSDVWDIKNLLADLDATDVMIIPKIESQEGIDNIDGILAAADGIMVARGDLGVEIPFEDVPSVEQNLITKALLAGKPVITATQMLDSMQHNPRPTRAEVTDVTYAVLAGTDATMLSGESANGEYPVESVATMASIDEHADLQLIDHGSRIPRPQTENITTTTAISAVTAAEKVNAKAIISITATGFTARQISRFKPPVPIIAATFDRQTADGLLLSWGVTPFVINQSTDFEQVVRHAEVLLIQERLAQPGDIVIIVAGLPLGKAQDTNNVMIRRLSE
ncbi:pyruvate kinase [Lacticaseibacillus saniviri]|nr:pyruvate kinase [Lacticaseibacillus saniviri]MCG4281052.1 pyruvate kinase [Lacticaseibacillus saniviri]